GVVCARGQILRGVPLRACLRRHTACMPPGGLARRPDDTEVLRNRFDGPTMERIGATDSSGKTWRSTTHARYARNRQCHCLCAAYRLRLATHPARSAQPKDLLVLLRSLQWRGHLADDCRSAAPGGAGAGG